MLVAPHNSIVLLGVSTTTLVNTVPSVGKLNIVFQFDNTDKLEVSAGTTPPFNQVAALIKLFHLRYRGASSGSAVIVIICSVVLPSQSSAVILTM